MTQSPEARWLSAVVETEVDGVILIDARGCILEVAAYWNSILLARSCSNTVLAKLPAKLTKPYRKSDIARRLREVVSLSELLSLSRAQALAVPIKERNDKPADL